MSSRCNQYGRQPPIPGQLQNLSESEPYDENLNLTENKKDICRNFIWGTCNKNTLCRFRHDLDFDEMKRVLKFCHDYQNPPGCTREHCTYLHTTKDEESLFFTTGELPKVLAERHANMSSTAAETIPQIALYIQESLAGPPPPPTPAPVNAPPLHAPELLPATLPVAHQTSNMLPLQQLLPPPPPLTVPSNVAVSQAQLPMYTAPPPQNTAVYSVAQQPPTVLLKFDSSRPPPPLPAHAHTKNGSLKSKSLEEFDAQPFKIMKTDEEKYEVAHCDQCVPHEIRVEELRDKISRLQRDEECQALAYKQELLEYQNRKNILRSLVNQDLYNLIEEYIEIISNLEFHDVLAQLNQTPTTIPGMSTVPKQLLIQLIDYMFGNGRNLESMLSILRRDETLLQTCMAPRRTNASNFNVLHSFLDLLKQSNAPEQGSKSDFTTDALKNVGHKDNANACHRLTNGQSADPPVRTAPPPTYQYAGPPPPPAPSAPAPGPSRMYYPPPYQHPPGVSVPPPSAPLPACPAYHAARYPPAFYRQQQ